MSLSQAMSPLQARLVLQTMSLMQAMWTLATVLPSQVMSPSATLVRSRAAQAVQERFPERAMAQRTNPSRRLLAAYDYPSPARHARSRLPRCPYLACPQHRQWHHPPRYSRQPVALAPLARIRG